MRSFDRLEGESAFLSTDDGDGPNSGDLLMVVQEDTVILERFINSVARSITTLY